MHVQRQQQVFDDLIERRWGNAINPPKKNCKVETADEDDHDDIFVLCEDDDEEPIVIPEINEAVDCDGRAINQTPPWDALINAEIALHHGDETVIWKSS